MTNVPFTALIKSKGYNKDRLARACGISPSMISQRICGSKAWGWDEASRVCHTLDISYDEFATYFPAVDVKPAAPKRPPTKKERAIDAVKALLDYLEQEN